MKSSRSCTETFGMTVKKPKPKQTKPKKKPFSKQCLPMCYQFLKIFLSSSSIHGFSHLSERRHPVEIFIWISLISAAVYETAVISSMTLTRYRENPTVISMERDRFAWNTSFPGATICPTFKISEILLDKYVSESGSKNKTALKVFLKALAGATFTNFHEIPEFDEIPAEMYMKTLIDLQFEFTPSVSNSGSKGHKYTLQQTITETGICYSFNSQLAVYSSPKYWEEDQWNVIEGDEIFYVNPLDGEVFANVVNMSTGFSIYVHGPYEVGDISSKNLESPNGYFLQVYLTALSIFTSQRARQLSVSQRKCRFHHESNLRHSPVYSYVLCRMDCRANLAKQLCGCVPHFYRKIEGERICDVPGLHCLSKHSERLISLKRECECLPNCDEVNYIVEDMDRREWFLGSNLQWGLNEYPRMRLRRDVIFGFTDLLVYIGGMAGLFLGCSVLSFIEILYFFSIRLYWFAIDYGKATTKGRK